MKVLIGYASKTGTAKSCAECLSEELKQQDVVLADLECETPDLREYDLVVLGSSVRFGKARPKFNEFLKINKGALMEIPHGFFLCCGFGHEFERYEEKVFDGELRDTSFASLNFGGLLKLPQASWLERFFLRRVREEIRCSEIEDGEYTPVLPDILPENITMMASRVRQEIGAIKDKNR